MFTAPIQDILQSQLQAVPNIMAGKSFRHDWDELVANHCASGSLAIIDDIDTATALGDTLFRALKDRYDCAHITLPRGVKADDLALAEIEHRSSKADILLAVGSGTINDLAKYASFKAGKSYLLFPTAVSMNGYVSSSASLSINGHKQSLSAQLPQAVFADLSVICAAPTRLAQAGIGDSLARPTAQADWLLSHHLLGVPYNQTVYDIMKDVEPMVFEQARAIVMRDMEVTEVLLSLILLSGFGMTIAKSSQPASGGEHMLAHAIAMTKGHRNDLKPLHGEEMAVTTLLASSQFERLLHARPRLASTAWPQVMKQYFTSEQIAGFKKLYDKKCNLMNEHIPHGDIPAIKWQAAQEAISSIHIPPERIATIIEQAGLPDKAEKLGWNKDLFSEIIPLTRFTRDRFSWLDTE